MDSLVDNLFHKLSTAEDIPQNDSRGKDASDKNGPLKIDIVNIFRRAEFVEEIVDQAIQLKVPAIWMQEGVIHEKAAEKARQAGIFVVMDLCILKEHRTRMR